MTAVIIVASIFIGGMALWVIIRSAVATAIHESERVFAMASYNALKQVEHDQDRELAALNHPSARSTS